MRRPKYPPAVELGARLRARRHELGLSLEEFGRGVGLEGNYVGRVERGECDIRLRNLLRLASAADVDPCSLVEGLRP